MFDTLIIRAFNFNEFIQYKQYNIRFVHQIVMYITVRSKERAVKLCMFHQGIKIIAIAISVFYCISIIIR